MWQLFLFSCLGCKKTVSGSATLGQALLPIQIKPRTGLHVSASIARDREEIATEAKVGFDHELDTFLEPELSYSASGNYRNPMTTGVAQLYTNLRIAKLKYGILTSYCHAYAVRLSDDQKGVELSRPVLWDGRGREKSCKYLSSSLALWGTALFVSHTVCKTRIFSLWSF